MRSGLIIGFLISAMYAIYNIQHLYKNSKNTRILLDLFFTNLALCFICYFLNPDIANFNVAFFNAKTDPFTAYQKYIVNTSDYFAESDLLFFLYCISFIFTGISAILYFFRTHTQTQSQAKPQTAAKSPAKSPAQTTTQAPAQTTAQTTTQALAKTEAKLIR